MAFVGVNIYETRRYVSPNDPDRESPTVFELGVLTHDLRAELEKRTCNIEYNNLGKESGATARANVNMTDRNFMICKFGIRNIENFIDPRDNKPIRFDTTSVSIRGKNYPGVSDEILNMLGADLRLELAEEILKENTLGAAEIKN